MIPATIYRVLDHTDEAVYIGATKMPVIERMKFAWRVRHQGKHPYPAWLRTLDVMPKALVLEETVDECRDEREEYWIAFHRLINPNLLNVADYGKGTRGRVHSPAEREAIRRRVTGHEVSEETRKLIGDANRGHLYNLGRKYSEETIEKMRQSSSRPWTPAAQAGYEAQSSPVDCEICGKTCKGLIGLGIHSKRAHGVWESARDKKRSSLEDKVSRAKEKNE